MRTARIVTLAVAAVVIVASVVTLDAARSDDGAPFVSMWGSLGAEPGQFVGPFDVAVDREGFVYVTDPGNHRVQKFTRDGTFVLQWGSQGPGPGEFVKPTGIAIGPNDTLYVSDYFTDTVQQFTREGRFLRSWGKSGKQPGEFDSPAGLAVGHDGAIYVTDEYNFRIQKFTPEGRFLTAWGEKGKVNNVISALNFLFPDEREGQFYYAARVAVGPDHLVYVADSYIFASGRWRAGRRVCSDRGPTLLRAGLGRPA